MSFWTDSKLHPKIKSRFIVSFGTGFFLPNVKSVDKPSVEVSTKEYRLMNHYFNYPGLVKWQPIKITFVDMNVAGGQFDTSQMLYEMLTNSGYIHPTENVHGLGKKPQGNAAATPISTPEKASTIANSFGDGLYGQTNYSPEAPNVNNRTIRIQQIDFGKRSLGTANDTPDSQGTFMPDVDSIETWELINPIITNISWGSLDYGSDDLVECTLDIKYDWAEFNNDPESIDNSVLITNKYQEFSK
jgi:hypothetical protein